MPTPQHGYDRLRQPIDSIAKYNQLLRIEEQLAGQAKFAGLEALSVNYRFKKSRV